MSSSLRALPRLVVAGLVLLLAAAVPAWAAETYRVEGVQAQATAADPLTARDQALSKAQREALETLLKRLAAPGTEGQLPRTSDRLVFETMQGFEVQQEKTSATSYTATISVEFRREAVDRLLAGSGIAYVEAAGKPLVVVPLLVAADGAVALWEGDNPWRDAWARRNGATDPQRLVVPLGDLQDLQAVTPQAAQAVDAGALALIAQHYEAAGAFVATAMATVSGLSVSAADPGQAPFYSGSFPADGFDAAVAAVAGAIQDRYRNLNAIPAGPTLSLDAKARFADLRGWRDLKSTVESTPAVRRLEVRRLLVGEARVAITYQGDPASLRAALAQRGIALEMTAEGWELRTGVGVGTGMGGGLGLPAPGGPVPDSTGLGAIGQSPLIPPAPAAAAPPPDLLFQ
ncbi:DUF2066 domain-containing protein [Zavarzinia compransoris]|uniref:DUF2066 domain-containing protein n=1 Tax=Zavarzinia compransoris TaxID=1264899 RepID=A0A317E9V0_9PROT|nr:DUF2066 domain-containing protein [Zavarzinia compransoris]PWR23699.1 hypothetical protein DKG75_03785 [Zavarzinia compransoris]TDP47919.1 uncharacterized protein DUF2066 [Zavarzinia compransoris]